MKVRDVMGKPFVVDPELSVLEAAKIMTEREITTLFVVSGHKVLGILTDMDILRRSVAIDKKPSETAVKEIMTSKLITIDAEENIEYAVDKMVKRLPVVSNGRFVGILTTDYISAHAAELGVDSFF